MGKKRDYDPEKMNKANEAELLRASGHCPKPTVPEVKVKMTFSEKQKIAQAAVGCFFVLLILVFVVFLFRSCNQSVAESQARVKAYGSVDDARWIAEQQIMARLKAPSTAKITITQKVDLGKKYRITGYVDAQNSFGAMIRTAFEVEMEYIGDGKYDITSVTF